MRDSDTQKFIQKEKFAVKKLEFLRKIGCFAIANSTLSGTGVGPGIIKKVLSDNALKEKYNDYLIEFSESEMYTFSKFNSYFEAYKKTYKNEVIPTLEKVKAKYIKFDTIESDQTNRNDVNYSIGKYISAIKKEIFKLK